MFSHRNHAVLVFPRVGNLIGAEPGPAKRGPKPKLQQQLEELSRLPKPKQRFISEMIDTVLAQEGQRG